MISILFFGNTDFSFEVLKTLTNEFNVFVLTKKNSKLQSFLQNLSIPYRTFDKSLKKELDCIPELNQRKFDFICSCDFGSYIPSEVVGLAKFSVNVHPSILPKYRGAAPIQRAIMNLEIETGVSVIEISDKVDAGGVYYCEKIEISDSQVYSELREKLAKLSADLLPGVIKDISNGFLTPKPQDESQVSFAPKIQPEEEKIKISDCFRTLRYIHALSFTPGGYILTNIGRIKILRVKISDEKVDYGFLSSVQSKLLIGCSDGSLEVLECQIEGKRKVSAKEFLNGYFRYLPLMLL